MNLQIYIFSACRFQNHKLSTIRQCLNDTKNFTLACLKIRHIPPDRVTQRPLKVYETLQDPSLELLQEVITTILYCLKLVTSYS